MTPAARTLKPIFTSAAERTSSIREALTDDASRVEDQMYATAIDADGAAGESANLGGLDFGDQSSAYHLTKLIAAADAKGARVFGVVGAIRGAGTSCISRRIAGAFALFGRTTLFVDASAVALAKPGATPSATTLRLPEAAIAVRPSLFYVDLASAFGEAAITADDVAIALRAAAETRQAIIVDLPPIVLENGVPNPSITTLGGACDLVFLVCLSGEMQRKELSACIDTCKVVGLELDALILNDWLLPANQLLER